MAIFSKMTPNAAEVSCQEMIHPYSSSCIVGSLNMFRGAAIGSAKFFAIMYLFQFILKSVNSKKGGREYLSLKTLHGYFRSVGYGTTAGTIFTISNCFLRYVFGCYNNWNTSFLPSFIAGVAISIDTPNRRSPVVTSYANMTCDALLRRLEEIKAIKVTRTKLSLTFMACNAALMYLLKYHKTSQQLFWFFSPQEKGEYNELTNQERFSKWKRTFLTYFASGVGIQAFRLILTNLNFLWNPVALVIQLLSINNLGLGAFLGCYVIMYQIVEEYCLESKRIKKPYESILAGLVAGATIWLQPSRTIITSAVVTVYQITLQLLQEKGIIPNIPYDVFLFCLYNGVLYHMRAMDPSSVPKTFIRIMSLVTSRRSDYIYRNYANIRDRSGV